MKSRVFHSARIGGQLFEALMTAEGPYIWEVTPKKGFNNGVCLGVCQIRQFEPSFYRHDGYGWYIVKYNNEATVHLKGFSERDARELSEEFGINLWGDTGNSHAHFYMSKAWNGLKDWVKSHPRMAKSHAAAEHYYLPEWYARAIEANESTDARQ